MFRLTPVYALILGFIATLLVYCGTGPTWYHVTLMSEGCRANAWTNMLYINNLYRADESREVSELSNDLTCFIAIVYIQKCMGETWYLAVDMQLFLLSPLFVYPLWRWKVVGLTLLALATLGSLASNFAIHAIYNLPPTLMPTRP